MAPSRFLLCAGLLLWAVCVPSPAAKADNPTIPSLLRKGLRELLDGVPNQAIFDFSEALLLKPDQKTAAEIYADRSGAYLNKKEYDRAMADAEESIRLAPDYFRGYQARGKVYCGQGALKKARRDLDKALSMNPRYAGLYLNRGALFSQEGNSTAAIRDFDTALRIDPLYFEPYVCRGAEYALLGRKKKALEDYHHAIVCYPQSGDAFFDRAVLYLGEREWDRAAADLDEYIKRAPGAAEGYRQRAYLRLRKHDYIAANADLEQVGGLIEDDAEAQNSLAWLRATYPEAAVRDGQAAIKIAMQACTATEWDKADYIDTLAAAYAEAGQFEPAVAYEKMAIGLRSKKSSERQTEEKRLGQYRSHQPYRDLSSVPK